MKYLSGIKKFFLAAIVFFLCYTANAKMEGVPPRPNPPKLVNNLSSVNLLSAEETAELENKLVNFSDSTSNQVCIVMLDSLYGYDISEFATEIGQEWKVGQKKFDNGVVILVQPRAHKVFIAVGYGLEGAIPDATAEEIVQREIIPNFKQGNYYAGLDAATDVIISLAKGEYNSAEYAKSADNQAASKRMGFLIALGIILFFFIISRFGGGGKGLTIGGPGIFFLGGGFGGGGGGFGGGGGGGGFGGFGGGGFGGGGAGGSW